jgi:hypothetical protein
MNPDQPPARGGLDRLESLPNRRQEEPFPMSQRQLDSLRGSLASLVDSLCQREDTLVQEHERLEQWEQELRLRESQLAAATEAQSAWQSSQDTTLETLGSQLTAMLEQRLLPVLDLLPDLHNRLPLLDRLAAAVEPLSRLPDVVTHQPPNRTPTGISPTGISPTGISPTGISPTGISPTGISPTGISPTGTQSPSELCAAWDNLTAERDRLRLELASMEQLLIEALDGQPIVEKLMPARHELLAELADLRAQLSRSDPAAAPSPELLDPAPDTASGSPEWERAAQALAVATAEWEQAAADRERLLADRACLESEQIRLTEQLELLTAEADRIREENEQLHEQLASAQASQAGPGGLPHFGHEGLSWEERKRLLLMQLNSENENNIPEQQTKKLEILDVIQTTDRELAQRDREIEELRRLVEQQSNARDGVAVGAAAIAQLIESDELIQQERERLRALQTDWEEKLRQSEIDISLERAKLARERNELEEKLKQLEAFSPAASPPEPAETGKERKWLVRLGLKDDQRR